MKKLCFFLVGVCLLASGCVTVNYLGDRLTPTSKVDIYYSQHDVTKPFRVIGHMTCPNAGTDFVKEKFSAYAQKIGADAIVITGSTVTEGGKNSSDVANADALKYTN